MSVFFHWRVPAIVLAIFATTVISWTNVAKSAADGQPPADTQSSATNESNSRDAANQTDLQKMQGRWRAASGRRDGLSIPAAELKRMNRIVEGDRFTITVETAENVIVFKGQLAIDATKSPKTIDAVRSDGPMSGKKAEAIYDFVGSHWRICVAPYGQPRPTDFSSGEGSGQSLIEWRPATEPAPPASPVEKKMDEQALQLIRRVGKLYSGDPALRCRVTVDTRFVGANDANRHRVQADYAIAQDHRLALRMQDVDRPERVLEVRSDGERLITHVPGLSQYTESPAPTTREELNDAVMQFGHANTGALMQNLLRDDPESMLLETATHCEYVGQETLPGGVAHHVRCHQPDLNWDLWVADGDRPLALRFRTTRVTALMTEVTDESVDDWQIGGEPDAASFSISLPEGTKKVDEFSS